MKLLGVLAAGAFQLPLGISAMRASLGIKETLLAESRERSNDDYYSDILDPDGHIACTESGSVENDGQVTVVLAFSKCLNNTALGIVEQWVDQVKSTVATTVYEDGLSLTFQSTMVPGACEERSEKTSGALKIRPWRTKGGLNLRASQRLPHPCWSPARYSQVTSSVWRLSPVSAPSSTCPMTMGPLHSTP
ncbi:hypothetical protein PR001_g21793 [Phytophthora rubi]|uniref:Uncharacterized protein n=1 Tax=Phytophthora rubi TaxID=129364 RepID=A0A6A3J7F8_9STRA|nr:hypothetical protein PR001_g21793 [Phytophthora rubi]